MKLHCFLFAAMLPVVFPVVAAAARTTQDATPEMRCVVFDEKDSSVCFVLDTALWQLRQAATVSVAGTFNFWDADAEGYRMSFDGGQWKLRLPVDSVDVPGNCGRPEYKFVADGKYYILDWKSNWLGASPEDYSQEALRGEIERKHYALQYVIYLTALKRHLMATAGLTQAMVWDVIGGAFYVFVRGVNAQCALDEKGRRTGVYFDCPREAVDALDALLGDSND